MALMPRYLFGSPLLLLTLVGGHAMAQEAGKWLDRMNRAVDELNYRGTFVHVIDGTAEILNIVHRNVAGTSGERILSQDGPRREIVRENDQVRWILPDQKLVLLETRKDVSPLVSALPSYSADLEPHYEINLRATERIANRSAQMIEIKPRDEFRYGYLLWLDQETAMPLKSKLMDERGHTVDLQDVQEMIQRRLVEPSRLLELFTEIEDQLYRYPAVDRPSFRRAVERIATATRS